MKKEKIIAAIIAESKIHHNISTLGMKLLNAPDSAPADLFWQVCGDWVKNFVYDWESIARSDSGNRNLCGCRKEKPHNIREDGACREHDIYRVYQAGRMGATLYWEKYWKESNTRGVFFKYEEYDLEEMEEEELFAMLDDMIAFHEAVKDAKTGFPEMLKDAYSEWEAGEKEKKREEAMGYDKPLRDLLISENPAIVRLAKGIKKEFTK